MTDIVTVEYPFSRGFIHIKSADPYESPDFDPGFMNDERDIAPMVWGYIKSRETARRMDAYAGEVQAMHPFYDYDSPARANDMDLDTTQRYALPGNLSAGLQRKSPFAYRIGWDAGWFADLAIDGSWSTFNPEPSKKPEANILNSNKANVREELKYSQSDIKAVEEWVRRHVESTWHCLGVSSCAWKIHSGMANSRNRPALWPLRRATASSSTVCSMSA